MARTGWIWLLLLVVAGAMSWWFLRRAPSATGDGATQRVVLFAPNLNESAYVLGHGDKVIAVTDYCIWPREFLSLPRIGGMIDPNLERIAALEPDLLVVQGEAARLRAFAQEQGLRLAEVKMDLGLESVFAGMVELNRILGGDESQAAQVVGELRRGLRELADDAPERRPRAILTTGHEPESLESLGVVGGGTFLGELLEIAGADNVYAENSQSYFFANLETLVADPPELVIELVPGQELSDGDRERLRRIWHEVMPQVEVATIEFDGAMIPGPRVVETAKAFRAAIEGALP